MNTVHTGSTSVQPPIQEGVVVGLDYILIATIAFFAGCALTFYICQRMAEKARPILTARQI